MSVGRYSDSVDMEKGPSFAKISAGNANRTRKAKGGSSIINGGKEFIAYEVKMSILYSCCAEVPA
jgi:hypothetical protein